MSTPRHHPAPLLTAHGIVNKFGSQVVHDHLDLEVERGEILGIAGGSGSGKSVLLKTLIGLHKPQAGEVKFNGELIGKIPSAKKAALIGTLFQQGALFSSLTVAQNIMFPMREYTNLPQDEQEKIAAMKLELAGLDAETGVKYPSALSGGMVKRAAFARALALDPEILFLDEPTSDLDPLTASSIDNLILQLNQALGLTIVVVSHDLTTLLTICTRIAILVDKKIVTGPLEKMMHARDQWIQEFLHGPRAQAVIAAKEIEHGNG